MKNFNAFRFAIVIMAGLVITSPALAARSDSVSVAWFDTAGNFVGQQYIPCSGTGFVGGTQTPYTLRQSYPCVAGDGDPDISDTLPANITEAQACYTLQLKGDVCGRPPVYVWTD
ncbi:hypothetical protein [Pinirhizobacter soli]|uniref:hypothetical protein n=1 Tax=Pinirhizobacter soli TaxID=2786953 RepID=UPI00202A2AF5|nr:hypothetical protein [Pinirhizobacter soli]